MVRAGALHRRNACIASDFIFVKLGDVAHVAKPIIDHATFIRIERSRNAAASIMTTQKNFDAKLALHSSGSYTVVGRRMLFRFARALKAGGHCPHADKIPAKSDPPILPSKSISAMQLPDAGSGSAHDPHPASNAVRSMPSI